MKIGGLPDRYHRLRSECEYENLYHLFIYLSHSYIISFICHIKEIFFTRANDEHRTLLIDVFDHNHLVAEKDLTDETLVTPFRALNELQAQKSFG